MLLECTTCGSEFDPTDQFPKRKKKGEVMVKCPECRAPIKVEAPDDIPNKEPVGPPEPGAKEPEWNPEVDGPFEEEGEMTEPSGLVMTTGGIPPGYEPAGILVKGMTEKKNGGELPDMDAMREYLLNWLNAEVERKGFDGVAEVRFTSADLGESVEVVITATVLLHH